jgi:hypothetical protein
MPSIPSFVTPEEQKREEGSRNLLKFGKLFLILTEEKGTRFNPGVPDCRLGLEDVF